MDGNFGLGPWYVALLSNENKNTLTKHKTEIRCHTYAYEYASVHNALNEKSNWITLMLIGPFELQADALWFTQEWRKQVRGKQNKFQRGQTLFNQHGVRYNLKCWKNKHQKRISLPRAPSPLPASARALDIADIGVMSKRLNKRAK